MKFKFFYFLTLFAGLTVTSMAQQAVTRKQLLTKELAARTISKVDVKEIIMEPLQKGGLHKHPCPVFGYVAEGTLLFQIQGQEPETLKKGDAFYEPADTAIAHFDNASNEPLKFIAFYLTNGEKQLIEMLPDK
jgi:quercetin dioxygenase-like cupin family protein